MINQLPILLRVHSNSSANPNMANFIHFTLVSIVLFLSFSYPVAIDGKECTNTPTQISSHTRRYSLLFSSTNNSHIEDISSSHLHLTPTDDSAWSDMYPRRFLKQEGDRLNWDFLYRQIKYDNDLGGDKFLKEVSLHDVRLDPRSIHGQAQQTNLEYLLLLNVDSLLWSFRKTAGLPTPGKPYGGWEAPNCELRGHFVGHYLSATAQMWQSTHNAAVLQKMEALVSALYNCQEKIGTGYLSAFPSELFDRVEAIKPVWAPYYTIHKIMAGLLDQYVLGGNPLALKMVVWMADYFNNRVRKVISLYTVERHWLSLNEETGGMNEVLYRLYSITRDSKHLTLALLFDKPCFLGMLAVQADSLSGFHANTHIPIVIGSQMRYEVTGDPLYKAIGTYFMDVVNSSHTYATGGTSTKEFWSDPRRLASTLSTENEESCSTYNMLKVSRNLFRWTKEMRYAEYYERALTNGVLSIQRGREPGVMIYMLPLGTGFSKARSHLGWGTKFNSFWCCYGTGIESFSKLGDSIYFEGEGGRQLYIIQFISSTYDWKSGGGVLSQKVEPVSSWDRVMRITLKFSVSEGTNKSSVINLRIPLWTISSGANAKLNNERLSLPAPGNFLSVSRKWVHGDILSLELPMTLRKEAIKDDRPEYASTQAILYGPYLLAGLSNGESDLNTGTNTSPLDYITSVPPSANFHLFTISQRPPHNTSFVMTNTKNGLTMEKMPPSGTDSSAFATFRIVSDHANVSLPSLSNKVIGRIVTIEPFSHPGMVVIHKGRNENVAIVNSIEAKGSISMFRVVKGNDNRGTISFESESLKGCFLYSGVHLKVGTPIKLSCSGPGYSHFDFQYGTSFRVTKGLRGYHPISFVANGVKRKFLLMPLLSLRDESYTVYFNL